MDDAFGWSTQYAAAEPCLRMPGQPSDDDGLLSAFMCPSFHDSLHPSDQRGSLDMSHTIPNLVHCHDGGASLSDSVPPTAYAGLDTAPDMLPSATGAVDGGLFDSFQYVPNLAEGPEQATVSNTNTVFSGNISSGESNTCAGGGGGQDMEVASRWTVSRPPATLLQTPTHPPTKRKLDKHTASSTSATAERQRRVKRSAASSPSTSIVLGGQSHHQASRTRTMTPLGTNTSGHEPHAEATAQVKEMIYRAAAMRPVHQLVLRPPQQNKPRRTNVRISSDPQTVAARLRRERVSERLRVLQRLVPGGSRMDTASMLDEAASYLRFLKSQLEALESAGNPSGNHVGGGGGYCSGNPLQSYCYMSNLGGGGTSSAR